ncbi:MAG TPA: methylmalonyl-CoA mutase family protein [Acidobacteriaceae bacterium]|jgi:methylmalonyl-CoA mutase
MPEGTGTEILNLGQDFPPIPTATWEAAIQKDLKGADYEKKLVWRSDEGLAVRPYYRSENLTDLGEQLRSAPGQFPFVRGNGKAWEMDQQTEPPADAVRSDLVHEAGADSVQQLGIALAAGAEKLAKLCEDRPVDIAAREIEFVFAVGSTYFFEIAKLRAARMLWAQVVAAFAPSDLTSCRMNLRVRTSRLNKSYCDPYTNLLRVTTEAMSAAIGGCETLTIQPFGFDERLALGVQRVLAEEAHLNAVADPAGGSYYVEALTASLAREAWKLFQRIEAAGGYSESLKAGWLAEEIAKTRAAREKAVSSRRKALVGVNNYPDLNGKPMEIESNPEAAAAPFPQFRLAEPFEKIRERTARHALATGRVPKVLLLKRGDVKMRTARANFAMNFLGCAGFELTESEDCAGSDTDLIVLCSSDPEYLAFAQEVCAAAKVPVIVAGNPKEQIDALKAAGVQGFIHIASDAVETLTEWQNRLGVRN